jgi:hypothetical protein
MKLARFEQRWAEAAMGAIFPGSTDSGLRDIRAMDVQGFLRQLMGCVPFKTALGVRVAIWLVALTPLLVLGRLATVAGLTQADRERLVERLAANRVYAIRSFVLILKTMGALLYAGDDAVRARMFSPRPKSGLVTLHAKRAAAQVA